MIQAVKNYFLRRQLTKILSRVDFEFIYHNHQEMFLDVEWLWRVRWISPGSPEMFADLSGLALEDLILIDKLLKLKAFL